MKKNYQYLNAIIFFALIILPYCSFTQGVAVNTTGVNAHSSAIFDASSNSQGMLIPRMTEAEKGQIQNPAEGLQIFNTDTKCFEYFAYGFWQQWHCAICPLSDDAGAIYGNNSVCVGDNAVNYSVSPINNTSSYVWSYSGTGISINGSSETINIDFSPTATSGNLTVKGTNQCGDGNVSANFAINVNSIPSALTASVHNTSQTEITWNRSSVSGATAYKCNTTNNYSTAINNGTSTSFLQGGLSCHKLELKL